MKIEGMRKIQNAAIYRLIPSIIFSDISPRFSSFSASNRGKDTTFFRFFAIFCAVVVGARCSNGSVEEEEEGMGEFASPKRSAMTSLRLQSPTSPFFLGSNDDQLERAQARAARAAASRRKSAAQPPPPPPMDLSDLLNREQISELFQNCIKLASENVGFFFR